MIGAIKRQDEPGRRKVIVPSSKTVALTDEAIIRMEMKSYELKKEEYIKKFEGKYIALLGGDVLDSDTQLSTLATRVYDKVGYRAIYMPLVTSKKITHKIASPKLKQNKIA